MEGTNQAQPETASARTLKNIRGKKNCHEFYGKQTQISF